MDDRDDDAAPTRRAVLAGGAALLASAAVDPALAQPLAIADDAGVDAALASLSNWGRWGADDQLGTLNLITAPMRAAAAATVRSGRVVPLGRPFDVHTAELRDFSYRMVKYTDPQPEEAGYLDVVAMTCHGFAITHVDALCHLFTPEGRDGMYNGFSIDAVGEDGASKLGIEHVGAVGIVGRGVLLDVAAARGGPLPAGASILPEDLEAAERLHGVRVGPGDILCVRNGAGPANTYRRGTGLHAACLPWLRARDVAVLCSDSDGDTHPPVAGFERWTEPVHMVAIPYMGLTLIDQAELDALAAACAAEGRWSFFVAVAPWRFVGATGGAINPLAMF